MRAPLIEYSGRYCPEEGCLKRSPRSGQSQGHDLDGAGLRMPEPLSIDRRRCPLAATIERLQILISTLNILVPGSGILKCPSSILHLPETASADVQDLLIGCQ